jgi:hypothetical protein
MWLVKMNIKHFLPLITLCLFFLINCSQLQAKASDGKIKILVLIIDSDDHAVYAKLRKIWRTYMHLDPEHVAAYFIRGNPKLKTQCFIDGDTIWINIQDNWTSGITQKTILSMEHMLTRDDFDYVLRTCLSSFYIFSRLLNFLDNCPRERFYSALVGDHYGIKYGAGCGFLLSPDLAKMLVLQKTKLWNDPLPDDVAIGKFFITDNEIPIIPHKRMDFPTLKSWQQNKNNIPADVFQFRVKNGEDRRMTDEIYIDSQLLKTFYNISI